MSTLLNILWVVLSGFWLFLGYVGAGIAMIVTIIGIPFGIQSFKLAAFSLWPFGRVVVDARRSSTALSLVGNVLWFILAGFWLALAHLLLGVLLCITIIGIPLGIGNFKLIPLALFPFGKDIVRRGQARAEDALVGF
ncbi:MAG: YccF domain-containing protein [Actinomycetota bacterium]|nr:YccF domain-containing protein [Actinomycetota bacterium]